MKNKVVIESTFEVEKNLLEKDYDFIIGVDEAGRGPLAGPVVAAAVSLRNSEILNSKFEITTNDKISNEEKIQNTPSVLRTSPPAPPLKLKAARGQGGGEGERRVSCEKGEEKLWDLIKDSKKISEKRREEVFDFIHKNFYVGVGICNHETIDRVNILEATFLAMKKAVGELKKQIKNQGEKMIILVDGDKIIPNFSLEQKSIVSGDKLVKSISAASIIAKVTRDRMMDALDKKYPAYQFAKHKGYGTKIHVEALKQCGPCEIHRRTFAPVRNAINNRWKK